MGSIDIHKYPLVRLLIPLLGGIFLADYWVESLLPYREWFLLALACSSLVLLFIHLRLKAYAKRYWFGFVFSLTFVLLGVFRTLSLYPSDFFVVDERPQFYYGELLSPPKLSDAGVEYILKNKSKSAKVSLFVPRDSLSQMYKLGDVLAYYGRLARPDAPSFRYDFNYRKYLERAGVQATAYVRSEDVYQLGETSEFKLQKVLLTYREGLLNQFRALGLEGDVLSIVAALTLGVKSDLSLELKEAFSMAGVSHVLALSGLHIGLLYGLTQLVLLSLLRGRKQKELWAFSMTLALLWLFALFVGGSASVVRSVLLFSLLGLARILHRQGNGLNSLALVAFLMLLYEPNWLFDVGFQLSFVAVGAILIFTKPILAYLRPRTRLGQYVWSSVVVSTVAQFATAPLIGYYFSSFSVYFLLANLIVIPLITLLLYSLVALVLSLKFSFLAVALSQWVVFLTEGLVAFVRWISLLPGASVNHISIYPYEFVLLGAIGLAFFYVLTSKRAKALLLLLAFIVLGLGLRLSMLYLSQPKDKYTLELWNGELAVSCCGSDAQVWIIPTDSLSPWQKIAKRHQKEWIYQNYKKVAVVKESRISDALFWDGSVLFYRGKSLALLHRLQEDKLGELTCHFDYVYIDRRVRSDFRDVLMRHTPGVVVVPAFLQEDRKKEIKRLCAERNVSYLTLKSKAYIDFLL